MVGGQSCRQCEVYQERLDSLRSDYEVLKEGPFLPPFGKPKEVEEIKEEGLAERNRVLEQRLTQERSRAAELDESLKAALSELHIQKDLNHELQEKLYLGGHILENAYHLRQHENVERNAQLHEKIERLNKDCGILRIDLEQHDVKHSEKLEKAVQREQVHLDTIKAQEHELETTGKQLSAARSDMLLMEDKITTLTRIVNDHESENDQLRMELTEAFRAKSQLERMLEQYKDDLARRETEPRIDHLLLNDEEYVQNVSSKPMSIPSKRN